MTKANGYEGMIYSVDDDTENSTPATPVVEEVHHYHYEDDAPRFSSPRIDQLLWLAAIVLEILIGFRIFLKLIAANPQSGFAAFVYTVTAPFLAPFVGLTSTPAANGSVLEISSVIAMVVYALLFWLAVYVAHLFSER